MTPSDQQFIEFKDRIIALAKRRALRLRIYPFSRRVERMRVEIAARPYLIFFPGSRLELTPGRIVQRVRKWPRIRNKPAAGYVILARRADLSQTATSGDGEQLPPHVAVVGLWGTKDRFIASDVDSGMALILEAANIPKGEIKRLLNRKKIARPARIAQEEPEIASAAHWGRSPRRGMLLDAYRLERRLGRGQSAEVWKAELMRSLPGVELKKGATVALKIYLQAILHGFESLRVQREFSIAMEASHPNLAKVFDLLLSPSRPFHTFMAMEYIDGPTLKDYISQRGALSPLDTLSIARQLFTALTELHSLGAVHRDVKAANIMIASREPSPIEVKLVDLGIVAVAAEERFTLASAFLGSKHSAPLEQLTGGILDERTDIYGVGSVLFHCMQGVPMYDGVGPEGAIVRKMLSAPEHITISGEKNRDVALALGDFVNKCIRVEARDRPATAQQCLNLLEQVRRVTPLPPGLPAGSL